MEYLNRDVAWYTGAEGVNTYKKLQSLEDRTVFLYAYLQKMVHTSFDKDNTCFKAALFFADAVAESRLPYSSYPELVDPQKNPFLAYMVNLGKNPGNRVLYYGFMSVLHEIADPMKQNSWIYDMNLMTSDDLQDKLVELEHNFYDEEGPHMPNPLAFDIDEALSDLQLKLIWFFGNK